MMTGAGFDMGFMGEFGMAWLGLVLLFFIIVFARKWIGEEMGIGFNTIAAFIGAYVPYLIVVSAFCSYKWAFAAGIIGFAVGGFLVGQLFDSGGGYY
jgi:hypothetical protein